MWYEMNLTPTRTARIFPRHLSLVVAGKSKPSFMVRSLKKMEPSTITTYKYSKHYEKVFNFTRVISEICGADVVREDYKMTWVTWSLIGLVNGAIAFTFYTMYVGVAINNDWSEILKCLCMFCTGLQAYAKLINGLKCKDKFCFLHNEINGIYSTYELKTKNYHKLLKQSISLVKKLISILLGIVILVSIAIVGTPIFYMLFFKERIFIMPFLFPYIDYTTDFGYYFTSAVHVVCVFFGAFGNFVSDSWCFVFAAHIPLIKDILQAKFKELDTILEEEAPDADKVMDLLMDIFKWHQKYIVFCNTVKNLFFWVIFVQVSMEFVSIVCTIVCIFLGIWPAAPVFLVYSFVLFYFHCALGNLVETSNDDVISMIYDCCWYNLSVSQQKMLLIMLRESQQAEGMSIGGVAPLSMSTALQLTKTIYTFSMMFREFLN
ncbi:odorant receptor 67d-like [Calliphora vicina]|uniref:odorant receptor 67d-like n=1 Tax=Calliphora vicina TaxID=7373 RepID=UPI00325A7738